MIDLFPHPEFLIARERLLRPTATELQILTIVRTTAPPPPIAPLSLRRLAISDRPRERYRQSTRPCCPILPKRPPLQFPQGRYLQPPHRIAIVRSHPRDLIFIPCSHNTWQLRTCFTPSISTRHSKHVPMPQNGARGSPETDVLQALSASKTATAAVERAGTAIDRPSTCTVTISVVNFRIHSPRRQIRLPRNRGRALGYPRAYQLRRRQ